MAGAKRPAASQTLSRGLTALEVLADAEASLSIDELTTRLGLHRSITYRIVRTLEDHGLVERNAGGELEPGAALATLARNVSRDLRSAALPELTALADELGMTTFLTTLDGEDAVVTLASVEPRTAAAVVAQRPGDRHPINQGAPGRVLERQLRHEPSATAYETSHDEVITGLSSVAVPLEAPGQRPAALAVVYLTQPMDVAAIGAELDRAAHAVRDGLDG